MALPFFAPKPPPAACSWLGSLALFGAFFAAKASNWASERQPRQEQGIASQGRKRTLGDRISLTSHLGRPQLTHSSLNHLHGFRQRPRRLPIRVPRRSSCRARRQGALAPTERDSLLRLIAATNGSGHDSGRLLYA